MQLEPTIVSLFKHLLAMHYRAKSKTCKKLQHRYPQGRTKWRNCRLTIKNPDYQLGWPILAKCRQLDSLVAVTLSGILKAKQKLGITFNSDKLGGIDFTKFSKLTMCSA